MPEPTTTDPRVRRIAEERLRIAHEPYGSKASLDRLMPDEQQLCLDEAALWLRAAIAAGIIPAAEEQPPVTITTEAAAHVLFLERLGGWPPSTFGTKLLSLWTSADTGNAERLAVSFPEYGAAIALMRSGTDGIEQLRAIADAD